MRYQSNLGINLVFLSLLGLLILQTASCTIDQRPGCQDDDDCRLNRVCYRGACLFASEVPSDRQQSDGGNSDTGDNRDTSDTQRDAITGSVRLEPRPDRLDFGEVGLGQFRTLILSLTAVGGAIRIDDAFIEDQPNVFEVMAALPIQIAEGESDEVEIRVTGVTAPSVGQFQSAVEFTHTGENSPLRVPLEVEITSQPDAACLQFLDLPQRVVVPRNNRLRLDGLLENCGDVDIDVLDLTFTSEGNIDVRFRNAPDPGSVIPSGSVVDLSFDLVTSGTDGSVQLFAATAQLDRIWNMEVLHEGAGNCEMTLQGFADREGPEGTESLELPIGHHIDILANGPNLVSVTFELEGMPDESLGLFDELAPRRAVLVPDLPGRYTLVATSNADASCSSEFVVDAYVPEFEFVAWAVWPEPNLDRQVNDLDFYVAQVLTDDGKALWPVGDMQQLPSDCYPRQVGEGNICLVGPIEPYANFGDTGSQDDDGFLNQDYNTQGFGPELVAIPRLSPEFDLIIGTHVFQVAGETGARPRIVIAVDGEVVFLEDRTRLNVGQFWYAATFFTDSGDIDFIDGVWNGFPR